MYESEKKWWEIQGKNSNLVLPRRCEKCREEKRRRNALKQSASDEIREIATAIYNREHAGKEDEYAARLVAIADKLSDKPQQQTAA